MDCGFIGPLRPLGNLRQDDGLAERITRESLERASLRILARRYGRSKNTIMRMVHRVCAALPTSRAVAERYRPQWSGILVADGKVVKVYDRTMARMDQSRLTEDEIHAMHRQRWMVGVDAGTGDLPHADLVEEEGKIERVIFFRELQAMGYPLRAVISDGNTDIARAARFVYGSHIIHQLCTRHFVENLRRIVPPEDGEHPAERERLEHLIAMIQRMIEADTTEEAAEHLAALRQYRRTVRSPLATAIMGRFRASQEELCAHLRHPHLGLPHTNNDAENCIRQINARLTTIGRFMHWRSARAYCHAWALLRRFTPFTDCCKARSRRNGKCPLQLAGVDTQNIDPLKLRNGQG